MITGTLHAAASLQSNRSASLSQKDCGVMRRRELSSPGGSYDVGAFDGLALGSIPHLIQFVCRYGVSAPQAAWRSTWLRVTCDM